ncbi:hypothetical protein ALQ37_200187 [Pseudomonas syringae pv. aptata]|uniref:Uncharacterized protein n=1 Tax=Pseudomonas syringae pv. aptata TaxID=83167 RepID=A0A3M3XQG6_PSEAP|nr:hypothetical protein ALQ37_200187 [Pseudomonas syringae pv. aptata]
MEQQHRADALVERVFGVGHAHQRCLADVQPVVTRIKAAVQLCTDIAVFRIELKCVKVQLCLTPDHLHRRVQTVPYHAGAQNVVAINDHLQGLNEGVQTLAVSKRELGLEHIGVADFGGQVVIKNA